MAGSAWRVWRRAVRPGPSHARYALVYSTVVAAALIAGGSLAVVVTGGVTVDPLRLAVATVVLAVSLLARVPVGSGRDLPRLTWAPLGVMVACVLVPLVSVCLVAVTAAVVAHAPALVGHGPLERVRARYEVSAVAAAAGIAVAAVIGLSTDPTRPVPARADQPNALTMLLLVGLISFLVATALAVGWVVTGRARPALPIWRTSTAVGGPLVLGCLFIGVAGVVVVPVSPWWLAVLVPIFWLLHRTFIARTRLNEDHRIWAELADATRALHELDDRGVRGAALRGAARLFAPDQVELVLLTEARRPGDSGAEQGREIVMRSPPGPAIGATIKGRRLVVGGHEIGQLRLRFRRRVMLSAAEHDAFLTFADAVASALHDASTHRRLRAMTARSAYEAVHDPLTGLSNRFTVLARGNAELASLDPAQAVALILFNIDKFHEINDAMSHTAGDEVLRQLARRLVDSQRDGELLGYLGGDEFALLTADVGADHAVAASSDRASSITAGLAVPVAVAGVTLATEVSAGVVVAIAGASDMTELLRRADLALRQARREGARVAVYEAASDPASLDRLVLLADVRDALSTTDQFMLYLQPTVDLRTGLPVGAEASVYWRHPRRGLLAPEEFIGTVEQSDMAAGFSRYTVELAVAAAARWAEAGLDLPIAVNLCARCTVDPDMPEMVAGILARYGVPPHRLVVEVTEGVMESEIGPVDQVITGLREAGVRVSVDDFGTASASWSFLTRFAVDEVEIDRSFVVAMVESPQARAIVRTTVDLARDLGMRVVADGVERADQRDALLSEGVDAARGPAWHPPLPAAEAIELMGRLLGRTAPIG